METGDQEPDKEPAKPENLMNSAHKTSNDKYREEYDRIFRSKDERTD